MGEITNPSPFGEDKNSATVFRGAGKIITVGIV